MPNASTQSVYQALYASINGQDQWITVRGADRRNPALLLLTGPGGAFSTLAPFFAPWESHFTLVQWDQPGAGSTHARHGSAGLGTYTLERLGADAAAVVEFAAHYLNKERIAVVGLSGGSILGLGVARRRPDLLSVYVGGGQIVHWSRQYALGYELLLARARQTQDEAGVADLEGIGPPPWASIDAEIVAARYAGAPTPAERASLAALDPDALAAMRSPPPGADYVAPGVVIGDQMAQATAMYAQLRDEIWAFDAWSLGLNYDVPLLFFQGTLDTMTVTSEVERFAADVNAPRAEVAPIAGAGHGSFYLRKAWLALLREKVPT